MRVSRHHSSLFPHRLFRLVIFGTSFDRFAITVPGVVVVEHDIPTSRIQRRLHSFIENFSKSIDLFSENFFTESFSGFPETFLSLTEH